MDIESRRGGDVKLSYAATLSFEAREQSGRVSGSRYLAEPRHMDIKSWAEKKNRMRN